MTESYPIIALWVVIVGGSCALLCCVYMLWRNARVRGFRCQLIEFAYKDGVDWEQRVEWYKHLPDYDKMMNRFWVWPLEKFIIGGFAEDYFKQ